MAKNITFPCGIWTLINAMLANAWGYIPTTNAKGEPTRYPRKFVCPNCLDHWIKAGKTGMLKRRLATNAVVFFKDSRKMAVCHVCGFRKYNVGVNADAPACTCGAPLPKGRKKWCYSCRPAAGHVEAIAEKESSFQEDYPSLF